MGGRYLITGAQIGIIEGCFKIIRSDKMKRIFKDTMESISNQFVGNSENSIKEDVEKTSNLFDEG
jgi:hypothetical protein